LRLVPAALLGTHDLAVGIASSFGAAYYSQIQMELTLNLVWVAVAIVGVLVQIVMLSRAPQRESPWRKIVAMACALVILFFVISMTDDLHDQALLLEERKLARSTLGTRALGNHSSDRSFANHSIQFFPVAPLFLPTLAAAGSLIREFERHFVVAFKSESLSSRAPPAAQA